MLSLKNSLVTDIEFEGLMAPFLLKDSFVVAVSGGVDSLALVLLAQRYAIKHNLSMTALTVDHRLRHNSAEEALWVQEMLRAKKINHEILIWNRDFIPCTKIQERARNARYELLGKWCIKNNIEKMLTAHHQDDQIETFFMRLNHQSGLKGLSSMRIIRKMPFGLLLRPLLTVPKTRLIATLTHFNWQWRDDPSNTNDSFERVRLRKTLTTLYDNGTLSADAIMGSIEKLQAVDDFLDKGVEAFFKNHALNHFPLIAFQEQHATLQRRILIHTIKQLSSSYYSPPDRLINQVCQQLMSPHFKGATLAGLHFKRSSGGIIDVLKEKRKHSCRKN